MKKIIIFFFGVFVGVLTGYAKFNKCSSSVEEGQSCGVSVKHTCDAAVVGCEITAANVEGQLEKCEYINKRFVEVLDECAQVSNGCYNIILKNFGSQQTN